MIDNKIKCGAKEFVISSSGNAALAALRYINKLNEQDKEKIKLTILVGKNIDENKYKKIINEKDSNIEVIKTERPLKKLSEMTKDGTKISLRQSTDNSALLGYESLAEEIAKTENLEAVFVPTSSGTTAEALLNHFKDKGVKINVVQTTSCHPIAENFDTDFNEEENEISTAHAIVDKIAHRKESVSEKLRQNKGIGLIVSNKLIEQSTALLKDEKIKVTANGALALAGLIKSINKGIKYKGAIVCIIGGE